MKRKLGTAEIPAGEGIRKGIEYINEQRPDLLKLDIVSILEHGVGINRTLIVVYWWDDHK